MIEYEPAAPPLGAVGWFAPDEAGITDRAVAEAIDANPKLGRAEASLPTVADITSEQAVADKEASSDVVEVSPEEAIEPDPGIENPPADTTPPSVPNTDPAADAVVADVSEVYLNFDEEVSETQIVLKDGTGNPLSGSVAPSVTPAGWIFTPTVKPLPQGRYTVEVTGATDAAGNTMDPFMWAFTIGTPPSEGLVAAYGMEESVPFGADSASP
ncbi:hypothetical protein GCM10010116_34550 [Microbispora rosea subsp. aerata]|nr:Ig-like domain-containing protein [Microbispora rosea]GGO17101.1 hypothetical protein GCM10010116_34550 [Microbispora rosea subsp. aerata]GIH55933.1 hypothetical protein Mro02_28470 [Microbispora rosea subsp. aerata]GLJ81841.1 hypothetical protein GCM10017588_05660 [Microbispora rosea subsp. aerata]